MSFCATGYCVLSSRPENWLQTLAFQWLMSAVGVVLVEVQCMYVAVASDTALLFLQKQAFCAPRGGLCYCISQRLKIDLEKGKETQGESTTGQQQGQCWYFRFFPKRLSRIYLGDIFPAYLSLSYAVVIFVRPMCMGYQGWKNLFKSGEKMVVFTRPRATLC